MKKKNLALLLVSLVLVAAIGFGATLAFLTDTTNDVTNTFSVGNVEGKTLENNPDGDGEEQGYNYNGLQPGDNAVKAPYIEVAKGSVECYVYIKITGVDANAANNLDIVTDGTKGVVNTADWTKVSAGTGVDGIYRYNATIDASAKAEKTNTIFDEIEYDKTADGTGTFESITAKGFLIQATNITQTEADTEAAAALA